MVDDLCNFLHEKKIIRKEQHDFLRTRFVTTNLVHDTYTVCPKFILYTFLSWLLLEIETRSNVKSFQGFDVLLDGDFKFIVVIYVFEKRCYLKYVFSIW